MTTLAAADATFKEPGRIVAAFQAFTTGIMARTYYKYYVDSLGFTGNENVLEYGSGSGVMSRYLAQALPRGHLTCVDISKVWMGYMRKVARRYPNIDLMQGDVAQLDIASESYDVIFIHYVLHDIPAGIRRKKMKIVLGKLKTGGRVFIREPTSDSHGIAAEEIRAIMGENGLREISAATGKGARGWPNFQAIYVK